MILRPVGPAVAAARSPGPPPARPADRFTASGASQPTSGWEESLARDFGPEEARALVQLADAAPPGLRADSRGRLDLAVRLARGASRFSKAEQVRALYGRLGELRLSAVEREALARLADPLPT